MDLLYAGCTVQAHILVFRATTHLRYSVHQQFATSQLQDSARTHCPRNKHNSQTEERTISARHERLGFSAGYNT